MEKNNFYNTKILGCIVGYNKNTASNSNFLEHSKLNALKILYIQLVNIISSFKLNFKKSSLRLSMLPNNSIQQQKLSTKNVHLGKCGGPMVDCLLQVQIPVWLGIFCFKVWAILGENGSKSWLEAKAGSCTRLSADTMLPTSFK